MLDRNHLRYRAVRCLMLLGMTGAFSWCAALYFLGGGKGTQDARYALPKGKRVLVFVDAPLSVELPPNYSQSLGEKISNHLYKYNATDTLFPQSRRRRSGATPRSPRWGLPMWRGRRARIW